MPGVPHEVHDFLSRLKTGKAAAPTPMRQAIQSLGTLSTDAVAPAQVTTLIFDLDASTTAKTRVYLPGHTDDIVNNKKTHGELPNLVVGTFVTVVIQVDGKPSQVGVVDVQHSEPASFQLKVSDGPVGTKPLYVTG